MSDAAVAKRLLETVQDPNCPPNYPNSGRLGTMARNQVLSQAGTPGIRRLEGERFRIPNHLVAEAEGLDWPPLRDD